jgi:hypothetical protein
MEAGCLPELTTLDGGGMIQLAVDCLQFGRLAVRCAPCAAETHYCAPAPAFEIIRLGEDGNGVAVARVEIQRAELPTLKVDRLAPEERGITGATAAVNGKVVLARWRDEAPTHFKLSAAGTEDSIEFVLSGDCRHRLFWWRAEFKLVNDEVVVNGPFRTDDRD